MGNMYRILFLQLLLVHSLSPYNSSYGLKGQCHTRNKGAQLRSWGEGLEPICELQILIQLSTHFSIILTIAKIPFNSQFLKIILNDS